MYKFKQKYKTLNKKIIILNYLIITNSKTNFFKLYKFNIFFKNYYDIKSNYITSYNLCKIFFIHRYVNNHIYEILIVNKYITLHVLIKNITSFNYLFYNFILKNL